MRPPAGRGRIAVIDTLRGVALAGMVVFHGAWDLHYFGFSTLDPQMSEGWRLFGHGIASTFLALSGLGLVLAQRQGGGLRDALRRIGVVGLGAGAISIVTALVTPGEAILFGILHCIALGNLLALRLLRWPLPFLAVLAAASLAAPFVGLPVWPQEVWWIGLSNVVPDTLDYRPLLPWLGPILVGVMLGRMPFLDHAFRAAARPSRVAVPDRALRWAGRHSLAIYLVHQPVLFGALLLGRAVFPVAAPLQASMPDAAAATAFLRQCRDDCTGQGADPALCTATCHCVFTAVARQVSSAQWRRLTQPDHAEDLARLASPCVSSLSSEPGQPSRDPK